MTTCDTSCRSIHYFITHGVLPGRMCMSCTLGRWGIATSTSSTLNGSDYMIVCFFAEQAKLFQQADLKTFQIDTNYKHVSGTENLEVIWCFYSDTSQRSKFLSSKSNRINSKSDHIAIPLVRVFLNNPNPDKYHHMFAKVFQLLESRFYVRIKWQHLDGQGLYGITIDQDWSYLMGKYSLS